MIGTIQSLEFSQGGKPKVKIDGKFYFIKTHDNLAVGKRIDYETSSFEFAGKTMYQIDKFGVVPETNGAKPQAAGPALSVSEPELRFISNVVGSAITGGACKTPAEVSAWVKGARAALDELVKF